MAEPRIRVAGTKVRAQAPKEHQEEASSPHQKSGEKIERSSMHREANLFFTSVGIIYSAFNSDVNFCLIQFASKSFSGSARRLPAFASPASVRETSSDGVGREMQPAI